MSLLSWLYATPDDTATDAAIAEHQKGLRDRGLISDTDYQKGLQNQAADSTDTYGNQVDSAFGEGWTDGYNKVTGAINDALKVPLQFAWDAIPLWIWIGLGLYVAWQLGWLQKLIKK